MAVRQLLDNHNHWRFTYFVELTASIWLLRELVRSHCAINVVQELAAVFSSSLTIGSVFERITAENDSIHKTKPLCQTDWLVRVNALCAVDIQYRKVLDTLEQIAASTSSVSIEATGLHSKLSTLLGLRMAVKDLGPLEMLNRKLQSKTEAVAGMMECVNLVVSELDLHN